MGKIGPGGRGLLSASTPGKGQRPLPSGVPPSRPLCPHCSYTPPTPAYLLARLSPDLLWAGLVGGPSFAKQLQGRGKEPPTHTHTQVLGVWRKKKAQASKSDTCVLHNYLLQWFPHHFCAVN